MEVSRFTVRVKPKDNESLTSYLYRMVFENKCSLIDLANKIKKENKRRQSKYAVISLDLSITNNYDLSKLAQYIGMSINQIKYNTTEIFHRKFNQPINLLNREWESKYRRYCPCCLKEDKYYKLIWQVKEIEICAKHKVKLQSICRKCKVPIPYCDDESMMRRNCPNCQEKLSFIRKEESFTKEYLAEQERKYLDWQYILSEHGKFPFIKGFSSEESLTVTFLYLISKTSEPPPIPFLKDFINAQINGIRNKKAKRNRRVTPMNLLKTLRFFNISLEDFCNLQVPESFIINIIENKSGVQRTCQAPWCEGFGKSVTLKIANLHRSIKYSNVSVCKKCGLSYGFCRETNEWVNIDKLINDYTILINEMKELSDFDELVNTQKNLSNYRFFNLVGYMLNHSLIKVSGHSFKPQNLKEKQQLLKKLILKTKLLRHLKSFAQERYGWTDLEFFFIYYTGEIQSYIFFDLKKVRKKTKEKWKVKVEDYLDYLLDSDESITVSIVSKGIGCNVKTLQNYGLTPIIMYAKEIQRKSRLIKEKSGMKQIIDDYLITCKTNNKRPILREIYKDLGLTFITIKSNFPDIYEYICLKLKETTNILHEKMLEDYKDRCSQAIQKILSEGKLITYAEILRVAGLGVDYCRKYLVLRKHVDQEILRLSRDT